MTSRRFTKRQKNLLWVEGRGLCECCGCDLDPDQFHGDHIIPWSKKGPTSVHNGAALCPACNLKKGSTMLRKHQIEVKQLCRGIANDEITARTILADVHPGGGKSALPMIAASELMRTRKIDAVCWVVPRLSLQKQGEESSLDPALRGVIGHSLEFRQSTNDRDPCRGKPGFVTTYQAIGMDPRTIADEFRRRRYLLVLDEPHHVVKGGDWHQKIQPLHDAAAVRLLMTGTLSRSDRKPVAFLPYTTDGMVDVRSDSLRYVQYTRTDALNDRAVIPLHFVVGNGRAEWFDLNTGEKRDAELESCPDDDARNALRSALEGDYAKALISQAVSDWLAYRRRVYSSSKMLVVAPLQSVANDYARHIRSLGVRVEVATTDEGSEAYERIEQFRGRGLDVLVTVGMAYEGLDVKAITHIVGLTHYRSTPWIEQMLNRATRYNKAQGSYESQSAFAYVPADPMMTQVIERIRKEQESALAEERDGPGGGGGAGPTIIAGESEMVGTKAIGLDGETATSYEEDARIREAMRSANIDGAVPTDKFAEAVSYYQRFGSGVQAERAPLTASEREEIKRKNLEKKCRKFDDMYEARAWGTTNKRLFSMFGKARADMTEAELDRAEAWIDAQFRSRINAA